MPTYPIQIVDVFAEEALAGNQLAVVENAGDLSAQQMQAIALETNFSETTFVIGRTDGAATVRIFTPAWELPFAGHPTLGTAWVLTQGESDIVLELPIGPVQVAFDQQGVGRFEPPAVEFGSDFDTALGAQLLNLDVEQLSSKWPAQLAQVGPQFVLLPVQDLSALKAARLNVELHAQLLAQGVGVQCVFAFTDEAYDDSADIAARMFFESNGPREDAATGSANSALAAYLHRLGIADGSVVVDQGVEMGRPSRLYLEVGERLSVGGRVQNVIRGELTLPT